MLNTTFTNKPEKALASVKVPIDEDENTSVPVDVVVTTGGNPL